MSLLINETYKVLANTILDRGGHKLTLDYIFPIGQMLTWEFNHRATQPQHRHIL